MSVVIGSAVVAIVLVLSGQIEAQTIWNKPASSVFTPAELSSKSTYVASLWAVARSVDKTNTYPFPGLGVVGVTCSRSSRVIYGRYDYWHEASDNKLEIGIYKEHWCGEEPGVAPGDSSAAISAIATIIHESKHCRQGNYRKRKEVTIVSPSGYAYGLYQGGVQDALIKAMRSWAEKDAYLTEAHRMYFGANLMMFDKDKALHVIESALAKAKQECEHLKSFLDEAKEALGLYRKKIVDDGGDPDQDPVFVQEVKAYDAMVKSSDLTSNLIGAVEGAVAADLK